MENITVAHSEGGSWSLVGLISLAASEMFMIQVQISEVV